jgi:hypothetical protein
MNRSLLVSSRRLLTSLQVSVYFQYCNIESDAALLLISRIPPAFLSWLDVLFSNVILTTRPELLPSI